jgi:uncharacterized protein YggE
MKRLIYILIIISLFGCVTKENFKTIILKTSGHVEIEPDEASILIQINCVDKNIMTAKNCLIDKSNKLNASLAKYGIKEPDILTARVDLNKDFIWRNNSHVFNGYRASTSTNIKIRDLKILENLYPELLSNQKLSIGGLTYQHSKIDSLNEIAYLKALENANNLSEKILSTLPEKNKMITQISNVEISRSNNNYKAEFKNLLEDNELDKSKMIINIGNMIAEKQLYVEFKIY